MTHLIIECTAAPINQGKKSAIQLLVFMLSASAIWLVGYLTSRSYPWYLLQTPAIGLLLHNM